MYIYVCVCVQTFLLHMCGYIHVCIYILYVFFFSQLGANGFFLFFLSFFLFLLCCFCCHITVCYYCFSHIAFFFSRMGVRHTTDLPLLPLPVGPQASSNCSMSSLLSLVHFFLEENKNCSKKKRYKVTGKPAWPVALDTKAALCKEYLIVADQIMSKTKQHFEQSWHGGACKARRHLDQIRWGTSVYSR